MYVKGVVATYWYYVVLGCQLIVGLPLLPLYFLGRVAGSLLNRYQGSIMNLGDR